MSKSLRSFIGLLLLITTVGLSSCQSMINVMSNKKIQAPEINRSL